MTVQDGSDHSEPHSSEEPAAKPSVLGAAVGVAILGLLIGGFVYLLMPRHEPPPQPPKQTEDPQDLAMPKPQRDWHSGEYVGSQTCAECHPEIAEAYSQHPMANTLATVADASPIERVEGDSTEFESHGRRYRVERDGDRMIHTEFMTDANGELVYEQSEEVDYAVGSGENARTYLINHGGVMFESPITWYTEKGIWDLSPGYHDNPAQRFNRRILDGCVQCHSGHSIPTGDGTSARFEEQPFTELGISCERCHGPGKRHVEKFQADDWEAGDKSAEDMLIVNPAQLEGRLADSVCYQCHMGGKHRVLRKGKTYHDFRPGMATEDIWTVMVSPTPVSADGNAEFLSHVEQMESSACFRGSEGQMRCTTCHDPHRSPKPEERAAFYRDRCNSCHSDRGCSLPIEEREQPPALNSCAHCHLPSSGSSDIPHTSASDHRILRNPPTKNDVAQDSNRGVAWSIFDNSDQRMPQWEVQRAKALALAEQAMQESDQRLTLQAIAALEEALRHDPYDVEVSSSLGVFYCVTRNDAKAMRWLEAALQVDPHHELSLKNHGMMALQTGMLDKGRRSFESYLEVNQWDGTIFGPYAAILANTGHLQDAVKVAERGLRLDPTQLKLRGFAAQLYARLGDQEKSLQHREILQKIQKRLSDSDTKKD
ncbi:Tetratricopeptide repeat protein [Symmachiella dynata]|uniref:tetratricopeptide repeat protein n=1 Tax=Symmachiella dynata TaxID=2527995 RepID=UPI00118BA79D|nr:cytochrome c3 family protein [Symmachiella dynata]QDT47898.1 Tetratricopeptide repeat protein [Symmachiella dynata]